MPRPLSACAVADRGRRVRRPFEGSFFVGRGEACLALSPHARLLIEGDACVAPAKVPSSCVGARHLPRPLSACAAADRGRRVRRPYERSFFVCRGEAASPSACAVADRGRGMRRPYEGSFFVCRGEACLALSPHARLLIEGDACVAPTKVPSSCVGARHASPSLRMRGCRSRATRASPLRRFLLRV